MCIDGNVIALATLRHLSSSDRAPSIPSRIISEVAKRLNCEVNQVKSSVESVLSLLTMLGVVHFEDEQFSIIDQTPQYAIRSLSWYLENQFTILSNWERLGVGSEVDSDDVLDKGPYFLSLLERRRLALSSENGVQANPARTQHVAAAIIKGGEGSDARYLHQWDTDAEQFQLIGGKIRKRETPYIAACREVNEELRKMSLVSGKDYNLHILNESPVAFTDISRTYGALTEYYCYFFEAKFSRKKMVISDADRWLTLAEMRKGETRDGRRVRNPQALRILEAKLGSEIESLPQSVPLRIHAGFWSAIAIKFDLLFIQVDLTKLVHWLSGRHH